MLTLIADCGSTKVQWVLVDDESGAVYADFTTSGFNATVTPPGEIATVLASEVAPKLATQNIDKIFFYGAGCIGGDTDRHLRQLLRDNIPHDRCEVTTDLVGAARALFGDSEGIACILGTGSNSGRWDGHEIVENTPPMGYILGDEGSGAVLGGRLLGDIFKGLMPADIVDEFDRVYGLSKSDIIEHVYRRPGSNRFMASFCPFLSAHIDNPHVATLVIEEFTRFIRRNLVPYASSGNSDMTAHDAIGCIDADVVGGIDGRTALPVGFVGSIAHYFAPVLILCCTRLGYPAPTIIRSPMQGLVTYHTLPE